MRCSVQNDWAARLYTGLCGARDGLCAVGDGRGATVGAGGRLARAAIMLGSSLLFMLLGHQLTLDMSLTLFTTLTFAGFCNAQRADTLASAAGCCLRWAGIAGAFLTKGLIARVLPLLTLDRLFGVAAGSGAVAPAAAGARRRAVHRAVACRGSSLIQHRLPQFFEFFFVREHFQRF